MTESSNQLHVNRLKLTSEPKFVYNIATTTNSNSSKTINQSSVTIYHQTNKNEHFTQKMNTLYNHTLFYMPLITSAVKSYAAAKTTDFLTHLVASYQPHLKSP